MISFIVTTRGEFFQAPAEEFDIADAFDVCGRGNIEVTALDEDYAVIHNKGAQIYNDAVTRYIKRYTDAVDHIRGNVIICPLNNIRF